MTPPFLLDTSGLLAHYRGEAGHEIVAQAFEDHAGAVFTSAIVWLEFQIRLKDITPDPAQRAEALSIYQELLSDCLPVTLATAQLAFKIREATPTRLPNSDALIAATASMKGATLIHRDPHFLPIPSSMLSQAALPQK